MANSVALVCPVHKPKFKLFARFAESYKAVQPDCDLIFILSEDERPFLSEYREVWSKTPFIFAPSVPGNASVINFKKFHALVELLNTGAYQGIAAIDADSLFVSGGFHESFDRFKKELTLCGYPLEYLDREPFHLVVEKSCDYFKPSNSLDRYRQIYAWWNTLPWYVAEHVGPFLADIGYRHHRFAHQSWYAYDHILYQAWLASKDLIRFDDRHYLLEYPEMMRTKDLDNFAEHRLDWVRHSARRMPIFKGQSPLIYFHTDRE